MKQSESYRKEIFFQVDCLEGTARKWEKCAGFVKPGGTAQKARLDFARACRDAAEALRKLLES